MFVQISTNHSFLKESAFENIYILVKFTFLSHEDYTSFLKASIIVSNLGTHVAKFKYVDLLTLQDIDVNYVSQTLVPDEKVDIF